MTGYLEADFLGFTPPNVYDTSNSDSLRMRLYWVDVKNGFWEVSPDSRGADLNRNGLSALPGDLFYPKTWTMNYHQLFS